MSDHSNEETIEDQIRRSFFGRTKGKKLRTGQANVFETVLPDLLYDPGQNLETNFGHPYSSYHIEIGFGGGEHLAYQAELNPDIGFIGCEPFINGIVKLITLIQKKNLTNIRIWNRDATELLPYLPKEQFERAYLLYPDPWPKRRQRKRRFLSDENLKLLAPLLKSGSEFRFATDIDDYAGWGIIRIKRSEIFFWNAEKADDWRSPWLYWPGTRYEKKALREGRPPSYLTFIRK